MIKNTLSLIKSNSILKSSIAIGLITLVAKVLGYFEKVILAYYFGTSYEIDVYNIIITIILSVFIFFREVIEPGFLNIFLRAIDANDKKGAWNLFNKFIRLIFVLTILLSTFVYFFPNYIVDLFAPGFTNEKREMSINIIQIAFPACIFLSLSALTNITLNGLKKFALPASGELAFKAIILLSLFFLYKSLGIHALVFGLIAGALAKLIIHSFILFKNFSLKKVLIKPSYIKETWILTWPLLIGITFSQASGLIDNNFASYLEEGAISAIGYSKKIIELPVLLFPYILSVVIFPYFSELAIAKDKEKLSQLLSQSLAWITLIFIPLSVFFFIFSYEIVELIFKRGAFNEHSTILTAEPLAFYSLGMVFFAVETVLVIFYFGNSDTKTPIFIGILCAIENIILTYFFITKMGHGGIALALVVSKATKVIVLLYLLKNTLTINIKAVATFLFKIIISGVVLIVITVLSRYMLKNIFSLNFIGKALSLMTNFLFGLIVYIITLFLLRINRSFSLLNKLN